MEAFAARANIVRMSDVDFEFLGGDIAHDDKASALLAGALPS